MNFRKFLLAASKAIAALSLVASAATAHAAVQITTNNAGRITTATGVDVGGSLYDVEFRDGSCNSLFQGCDSSLFTFSSSAAALVAAQSLLDQVLTGTYDANPGLTRGCSSSLLCNVLIPFRVFGSTVVSAFALNTPLVDATGTVIFAKNFNTGSAPLDATFTYALFSPSSETPNPSAVPEPATWLLMMAGFGLAGFALRRRPATSQRRAAFA